MAVSRSKSWISGEILSASDLNQEFNNIISGGESLGWPATVAKDLDGQELILDADADTSITADTDDRLDLALAGTDLFRWLGTVATPVNGLDFVASAAGNAVQVQAVGSDTNITINMVPKGTGTLQSGGTDVGTGTLSNIVEDTTPQLGGVLDTNAFAIDESEAAAVASAATTDIWATTGNTRHITGTVTITSFGTAPRVGAWRKVIFDAALTLTDGANLNLPGAANIITAADDFAFVYAETTTLFKVMYFKEDGTAVVVAASGDLAAGDRIFFQQTTPSANFTKETSATYDDAGIRLQTGTVVTGGTDAWSVTHNASKATDSHTLTIGESAAHTHTVNMDNTTGTGLNVARGATTTDATHTSSSSGGGGGHTHTMQTDLKFAEATIGIRN